VVVGEVLDDGGVGIHVALANAADGFGVSQS
jgi:hypothetical protein